MISDDTSANPTDGTPSGAVGPTVVVGVDADGTIDAVAGAVEDLLGWTADELVDAPLTTIIPERFHAPHSAAFSRFVESGELRLGGQPLQLPARRPDGTEVEVELLLAARLGRPESSGGVVGVLRSIVDAGGEAASPVVARVRARLEDAISADRPLDEVVGAALEPICEELGWAIGVVWALDPWIERLTAVDVWERTPGAHPTYVEATRRSRFVIGEGFAGTVWRTQAPWWSDDLPNEADFHRAGFAAADGLQSAFLFPILAHSGMVGMVELVDDERRSVDADTQRAGWVLASELGVHLGERLRRETERVHRQRLELALSASRTGLWTYHLPTGQVTWDPMLEEAHGVAVGSFAGTFDAFVERIDPDDRDRTLAIIGEAAQTASVFDVAYRTVGDDGVMRWIEGSGVPILDEDGEMQVMAGVGRDVTARVRDRQVIERRATNAALAADAGRALVAGGSLDDRLALTVEAIVQHLDVAFARVWTLADESDELVLRASAGMYTHLDGAHARIPVGSFKIGRIAASREPHVTNDVQNDDQISDPEWARREGMQSFVGYPLLVGDRCVGVIGVFARRPLSADIVGALGSITNSVAVAISEDEEARRVLALLDETRRQREYAEQLLADRHRVASVLQASLLPPDLPDVEGLELAATYRSGVEEVGGDFYDVFPIAPGRWAIMIGDVCGRGPEAARLTALSRHTLRTALLLGRRPAGALAALDTALRAADNDGRFCTAVCGLVEQSHDGEALVRLAVGGHPPPQIVRSDGRVESVDRTGPLIGVVPEAKYGEREVVLCPGDAIVLYTDGIVEAHGDDGLFGVERLAACIREHHSSSAEEVTQALLTAVNEYDDMRTRDDLAILTIRRT